MWLALLALVTLSVVVVALLSGPYGLSAQDVAAAMHRGPAADAFSHSRVQVAHAVVWNIRLPRILLALLVGAALAASGSVFQACFRNPLVEPYVLGVSSGAAFGAALGMVVPRFPFSVQVAAFLGALAAVALVQSLAPRGSRRPVVALVLSGLIVGSMFAAGVSILKYVASDAVLRDIVFWLMGGLYFATWSDTVTVGPVVVLALLVMTVGGWQLNVLALGDDEAQALGVEPRRARQLLLGVATLATASSVSVVGVVPWIGMMTPHAARLLFGPDNRLVVPASALVGASFLLACDTAARSLTGAEVPVGIVTALAGGPFLAYLVRQRGAGLLG